MDMGIHKTREQIMPRCLRQTVNGCDLTIIDQDLSRIDFPGRDVDELSFDMRFSFQAACGFPAKLGIFLAFLFKLSQSL